MQSRLETVLAWISRSDEDWEFDEDGDLPFLFVWAQSAPGDLVDELGRVLDGHDLRLETVYDANGGDAAAVLHVDGVARPVPVDGSWRDPFLTVMALADALRDHVRAYVDRDDLHEDALDVVFLPLADAEAMEARYPERVSERLLPLRPGEDLLRWVVPGSDADAPVGPELAAARGALRAAAQRDWEEGIGGRMRLVATLYRYFRDNAASVDADWKRDPAAVNALAERLRADAARREPARTPADPGGGPAVVPLVVEKSPWWKFW